MLDTLIRLDQELFLLLNGKLHHPFLDDFFPFITDFGNFQFVLVIALILLLIFGKPAVRKAVLLAAIAVAVSDLIGNDVKILADRLRPFWTFPDQVRNLLDSESSSRSFPSNHAINMFAACTVLAIYARRWYWRLALLIPPALAAYSRVYVGVHYPADILAGALMGSAVALGLVWFQERHKPISKDGDGKIIVNWTMLAIAMILISFLYRYSVVIRQTYPLSPEEAQYWDWSRHLDFSYYSKPPLIAYLLKVSTSIFGHTAIAVRGTAVTLALGMTIITWKFGRKVLQDDRALFFALLMLNVLPLYAIGALVMTTDNPLMFFWAATSYTLFLALFQEQKKYWYIAGITFGLGMLSKYAMIYIVPCLVIYLALAGEHRHWLRRKEPYLFLLIGLVMFLPVIYWSWNHDWVNFLHVAGQAKVDKGFQVRLDTFGEFLGSQILLASPALFLGMVWYTWSFFRSGQFRSDRQRLLLVCLGVPVFAGLLIKSLQGNTLANWDAPAYYTWTLFAAYEFFKRWDQAEKKVRRWLATGAGVALLFPIVGLLFVHEPDVFGDLKDAIEDMGIELDEQIDPGFQMIGYDEVGLELSTKLAEMPQPEKTFVFTKRYQEASEMAFYMEGNPRTYNINFGDRRMNQYFIWGGIGEHFKGWDAIYLIEGDGDELKPEVADQFEFVNPPKYIEVESHDRVIREFTYWRLYNFSGTFPDAVQDPHEF